MKTRAAVLRSLGHDLPYAVSTPLSVEELDLAEPGPGEVLLRIEAAGLCHSDLSVVDGSRPRPLPLALGHEAAGIVAATGPGVSSLTAGDHVVCTFVPACGVCEACASGRPVLCRPAQRANGAGLLVTGRTALAAGGAPVHHHLGVSAFSEYAVVSERSLVPIPADVPFPIAAVLGCAVLTGVGAVLNTAGVAGGDSVAVFGLGGVGLAAVMGAVVAGAAPIIAVDRVPAKLDLAADLGADIVIAADEEVVGKVVAAAGGGVDWAFEAVGSVDVLQACYEVLAPGGTAVAIGLPHPDRQLTIQALSLVAGEKGLRGSYMGSAVPGRDLPRLLRLYGTGRLPIDRLVSSRALGLGDLNRALDALAAGEAVRQIVEPHAGR